MRSFCLILPLLLSLTAAAKPALKVIVHDGPSKGGGSCPSKEDTIEQGNYVEIHFSVSIDESSATGEPGQEYENTREDGGFPIGVTHQSFQESTPRSNYEPLDGGIRARRKDLRWLSGVDAICSTDQLASKIGVQ